MPGSRSTGQMGHQKQKVSAYGNLSAEQPGGCLAVAGEIAGRQPLVRPAPLNAGHRKRSLKTKQ